ncbi:DNA double-strand break repair protein Mre11 [Halalkalicoccus jeotgali]|uniref:DNA double-strand break repair protein Mre11 n=1 Tax=Halalkalicoccus jeotgali (strain DSM 18796 / CECT 7217 / JCM 14584 / KCTC 4019 / B3) TaxID=795797 RepID=D8J6A3_HALJB|nr:DNA double-strand break repair protein Mre11 [Halalkalicoccus jeotgali]ADJ15821.1 metallophosphoesterase [Halalkalicoccus jeotgali B3]ELY38268.1 metallophosphoesterase [Halalkalicoccus jeotgali B3]
MTRVIHTGDTHIGYRQYHSAERRADFLAAFERVAADAIEEGVDAVVHAGDLFHDRRPDIGDLLGTLDVLRDLEDADVPFLAIVGNHEGTREGQWLDLFSRMGLATRLDSEGVTVGETTFYGLDHVPVSRREELEYDFALPETDHAALVAHGLFEPFGYADWDTEELLDSATVEFDAMLLGDNHHPDRAEVEGTWVTYCGSTERATASERDGRGYNLVTFEDGEAHITRRGLDTREFVFADVQLAAGEGIERVLERVGQHDLDGRVVIVTVEGEGEPLAPAEVESFAREGGALIARVNDKREIESGEPADVSFSDPDAAVRERLREMGLSGAASDIDETVRASKLADSNVRGAVEERVTSLLEEDPAAFEPAATAPDGESPSESPTESADGDTPGTAGTAESTDRPEGASADRQAQSSMEEYL